MGCHLLSSSRLAKKRGVKRCSRWDRLRPSSAISGKNSVARRHLEAKARLATTALLVRVATVDSDMSEVRAKELHRILRSRFRLDDSSAAQLIEDARAAERSAIDLYQFTRQLNEALDGNGRHQVVQMMWEIAYVEGRLNGFEANVIWRTADLLGVSSRQRVEMRQQLAAERSISA